MKLRFALMLLGLLLVTGLAGCGEKKESQAVSTEPTRPEVIAAIEKLGGEVTVDGNKAVVSVDLRKTEVTDAGLVHLKGLTNLETKNQN